MLEKIFPKEKFIGSFKIGNIVSYNYIFRGEREHISTNIYSDKDISLLFYAHIPNIRKDDVFLIRGYVKGKSLNLYGYRESHQTQDIIMVSNIDVKRFYELLEQDKASWEAYILSLYLFSKQLFKTAW